MTNSKKSRMMDETGELVQLLRELVAAKTVNPPGNEAAAAAVVARYFDEYHIPYKTYEKAPGRTNIIGKLGSGSPTLIIASHLDTVPAGDGWTSDPFTLRVEGNLAYGRGANDNKAAMAGSLIAAKRLALSGTAPGGTLLVAGVADEERGNDFGAKYLLEDVGLKADFAIVPDSAGHMQEIDVAEKGVIFVRITCKGKAAHASKPAEGVNAVTAMADLLSRLCNAKMPARPHPHFSPATMNIGRIRGGLAANIVPDACEADLDFRVLPGISSQDILEFVNALAAVVAESHPGTLFEAEVLLSMPPHEVPVESSLVRAAQAASRRVFSREMRPIYMGGVTIAKEFALAGIPAVGMGPGTMDAAHTVDEWIEIDEVVAFVDFLVEVTAQLLSE